MIRRFGSTLVSLLLLVGLLAVLVVYFIAVNDLPARIYTPVQQEFLSYNSRRSIVQAGPEMNLYDESGNFSVPIMLPWEESHVRATLAARYQEQDGVSATIYDLDFRGEYLLSQPESAAAAVNLFFPFPANLDTLHQVRFLVDGEEPAGVEYSTQGISWRTELESGKELQIVITYRAEGANSFSYGLPRGQRANVDVMVSVENLVGSQSTQNHLRPTSSEASENSETFIWNYSDLIIDRDIRLELPTQLSFAQRLAQLQDEFRALAGLAPVLVMGFLAALFGVFYLSDLRLRPELYLLAGLGLALFYPLLTFLSGLMELAAAAVLAVALVAGLLLTFLGLAAGWRPVRWRLGLLLLVFLGFFSLGMLTPWHGLSLTAGGLVLVGLFMVLLARRPAQPDPELEPDVEYVAEKLELLDDVSLSEELDVELAVSEPEPVMAEELAPEPAGFHCPFCGRQLDDEFSFCPACGRETRQLAECPSCESKQFVPAEQDTVHCLRCGESLA